MKIVDVAEYYAEEGGGIKTYIQSKMRAAEAAGHEVVVVAPGRDDYEESKFGGRIRWVKGPRMPFDDRYGVLWNMKKVHRILDEERPDLVESSSAWAGGQFVARWPSNVPKTLIFHQDPVAVGPHTYLDRYVERAKIDNAFTPVWKYLSKLSKSYDATIVAGQWLGERLASFGVSHTKAIPFGIDKSLFTPKKSDPVMRKALLERCGLPESATLMLTVSRLHPEKRLDTLFHATRILNETQPTGLIVFGAGYLSKKVRRLAESTTGVCLAGYTKDRDELATVYASADLMIHGSAAETFGLGVAEAICSGLPIVAPSVGGAADLVTSDCGFLYEPGDAEECAAMVKRLLARERAEWLPGLRRRAKKISTVDEHFDHLFEDYAQRVEKRSI